MKKIILILMSTLLLINCKDDDDNSGSTDSANEIIYLDESHTLEYARMYYIDNSLNITTGTGDDNYGVNFSFLGLSLEDLGGIYTLNTDENTYDPENNFSVGILYYLNDSMNAASGEITVQVDPENETIQLDFEIMVDGDLVTGHYEGIYSVWV